MYKENFHNHTTFCDGRSSAEEMVLSAIEKGFDAIGFSGHAYMENVKCSWCMSKENTFLYLSEIEKLKEKYSSQIELYKGTELDYFCTEVPGEYEFTLAAVHYLNLGDEYQGIDITQQEQIDTANRFFDGSMIDYSIEYFKLVGNLLNKFDTDFIGHFDLLTKFNEGDSFFDTKDKRYIKAWTDAVDNLIPHNKPFEINTGAIARGKRTTPYPALDIAEYIHSRGGYFIVTSDCHDAKNIDCAFDLVTEKYSKFNIVSFYEILKKR